MEVAGTPWEEPTAIPREGPTAAPTVSVVISTHSEERWKDLLDAIDSVARQTYPAREIVVVVARAPHLLARLEREGVEVRAVANADAPGLCGARNTGVAVSEGDVVAFLDDDATAEPNWLEDLVHSYTDEHVLGVGGAIEAAWIDG